MKAYFRKDLLDEGLRPTVFSLAKAKKIDWALAYECWQPDCLDDEEFNLVLALPEHGIVRVSSIDFDFISD